MQVICGKPPNFDYLCKFFPMVWDKHPIFAYAPNIYAPSNVAMLSTEIWEHEKVHIKRQEEMGVERWWKLYCIDKDFRFSEELLAHRAEYKSVIENHPSRHARRSALKQIAKKLSSGLYGNMTTMKKAMELLEGE